MSEPAFHLPFVEDLDDGPLSVEEEAALVARLDAALAEEGESVSLETLVVDLGDESVLH
ncbi:hypothetical protein [Frankia sp. Cas3]|uniref:hypothetical protein n=1 Tax=Frankia sp. Cas3 TaxID=3073926 RepID=UPI002AD2A774|nr:hypothetical protein [Frankia sp. Cas3]